jgi:hypothetical protein
LLRHDQFFSGNAPIAVENPEAIRGFLLHVARASTSGAKSPNRPSARPADRAPAMHSRSRAWQQGATTVCYSAKVWQAYQDYVRRFGAVIGISRCEAVKALRWASDADRFRSRY